MNSKCNGASNGVTAPPSQRRSARTVGGVRLGRELSPEARKQAAAILEVLAGVRTPQQGAEALGISLPRYYQVEQRGLEGLLSACEPRAKGRSRSEAREADKLRRDKERLQQELVRQQTLLRLAQRSVGLAAPATPVKQPGKKRPRRPVRRALAVAQRLRQDEAPTETTPMPG